MTCDSESIRHAISRGDYAAAQLLWEGYTAALREQLAAGRAEPNSWAGFQELFMWSRTMLMCSRAHNLDCLNAIHVANVYARMRNL